MRTTLRRALFAGWLAVLAACPPGEGTELPPPVSPTNHRWFPLAAGTAHAFGKTVAVDGTIGCASCHPASATSFTQFECVGCHQHTLPMTNRLHLEVPDYAPTSADCYQCHPAGEKQPFSHRGIPAEASGQCAECHQPGAAFAALPKPGFTHSPEVPGECGSCHQNVLDWSDAAGGAAQASDPTRDLTVDALQPAWVETTIVSVAADRQVLPMTMNHQSGAVAGLLAQCTNCHAQADQGQFYPGVLHFSLISLAAPQPTTCVECHRNAAPKGFVGALDARRVPSTGEMKHDAVLWDAGAPTNTAAFTLECQVCHEPPTNLIDTQWTFAVGRGDGGVALFHASLTAAGRPQPQGCLDCHANTRPTSPGPTFDHATALGECSSCHRSTTQWSGGQFHTATAPSPTTCLPCHAGDRPVSTAGWMGTFLTSPFDFVTNINGVTHGADRDCAVCHAGPGTGVWGVNQNWRSGRFTHAATATCIDCHTTQRPDLLTPPADAGYDHASSGTGDCFACHQATVTRGSYVDLLPIPGGDWRGGQSYPGDRLISTPGQSVRVLSTTLTRTGALVTGMSTTTVNLPNAFLHTSSAIPAAVFPGSAAAPDQNSCWHCHTATGTTVTAYANGSFHAALSNYRATPAAAITPLPQPATCDDCHAGMRPPNIVSKTDAGAPWLLPMDHSASLSGGTVANVPAMDCGSCHRTPGLGPTRWSDGKFHPNLPGATSPAECVSCHFPLITTASADVTADGGVPPKFTMKHRSTLITTQACATCHDAALSRSSQTPTLTTLWKTGSYHSVSVAQPATCLECHGSSDPLSATQGLEVYTLAQGATATNGAQWMNHQHLTVTGRDCATCHRTDARQSGSAWNRSSRFHANTTAVSGCAGCHGLNNGRGTVVGTNNNLPAGLIDSATFTTASTAPANTPDQLVHSDLNVTRVECNFCHTQVGPSTVAGVQGREWSKAVFHRSFTSANPMVVNGTTARCSNCHVNVKPARADHAAYTATSAQDCASCHSWPGTNPATPNWLGATSAHAASGPTATSPLDCNTCHGQGGNSSTHLSTPAAQHFGGISNGNKCTSCHVNFAGFKGTVTNLKYAHTNATANGGQGCVTCHAFSGQLYTTLTTTPALTRPTVAMGHQFSQATSVTGQTANCGDTNPNGCFTSTHANAGLTRCGACHQYAATTAATNIWAFKHRPSNPGISNGTSTTGCSMCH